MHVSHAQEENLGDTAAVKEVVVELEGDSLGLDQFQSAAYPKSPTKAALYSAILPGLGQAYNKRYWKIPVVIGLLGAGIGFISYYQNQYDELRSAFVAELNGEPHAFSQFNISAQALAESAEDEKRFRDYAIVITSVIYILNILDAAVDAHLFEFRTDPDLSLHPTILPDASGLPSAPGLGFSFKF